MEIQAVRRVRQMGQHLFPNVATCVDDIAFLHSMTADSPIHGSAMLMMNSGKFSAAVPASARGSITVWAAKTKTCRASS